MVDRSVILQGGLWVYLSAYMSVNEKRGETWNILPDSEIGGTISWIKGALSGR